MLGLLRPLHKPSVSQYGDNAPMDNFFFLLIITAFLNFSSQGPVVQRCPPCVVLCNDSFINTRLQQCRSCQCEPIRHIPKLVPVMFCPFKLCSNNCGFMGYKLDSMGCKSCECQEI